MSDTSGTESGLREHQDTATSYRVCLEDEVLGPVVRLAELLGREGLDVEEVATVVGSVFYAAAAAEPAGQTTAARAADLFRALKHVGLDTRDAGRTVADVLSRRIA